MRFQVWAPSVLGVSIAVGAALSLSSSIARAAETKGNANSSAAAGDERREKKQEINPKSKLLWIDVEAGITSANLHTFNEDWQRFAVGFLPSSGTGPSIGAGAGLRLVFVTIGARGRVASFDSGNSALNVQGWTMSSIDGEIGLRVPLHRIEPFVTLAGGYTTFGGFGSAVRGLQEGINVNGFNTRLGVGVDWFFSRYFSVGMTGSAEALFLTRPGIPARSVAALPASGTLTEAGARFLAADGSTYGLALGLNGGLKVSF